MTGTMEIHGGGVAAFALRHRKAITLCILGLCAWGAAAVFYLPEGIYPDVAFPRIVVIAERGEESVENMLVAVTRPIEDAVNAVPGLKRVRSKTIRGASELSLDFLPSADMRDGLSQTRARVATALSEISGVATTIEQQTPSVFPVISFNVSFDPALGKEPVRDLGALLEWTRIVLKPRLSRLPEVFLVTVQGAETRQITVEADPARLAAAHVGLDDLVKALKGGNDVQAVGILERDYKQFQLLASHELRSIQDIEEIPIASKDGKTMPLRNLARVSLGLADRTTVVTGDGKDSVIVSLFMRFGGKVIDLSDRVGETLEELAPALPPGVTLRPVYDQAHLVRESIAGVRDAIVIGIGLAVAVLWVFLGSWRTTLIAAVSIPISVLGTFAIMSVFGESLNLMSLGGVAVAIGLIIDDAIVVVENIARRLRSNERRTRAIIEATQEILGAVVGSSLTTVVVFLPLIFLEGIVGQFFRALALALAVGILVSMVVSLTLTPVLAAGRLGPRAGETTGRRWMDQLAGFYESWAIRALKRPVLAALILVIVILLGAFGSFHQATGFLPEMDEGGVVLDYTMPVGTSLGETDKNCRKIEAILKNTPGVGSFSRRTGAELGFFATEQFTGDFLVGLKSRGEREEESAEIVDTLRERIAREVPQIEISFVQVMQDTINDLAGNPAPIEVKVFGNDYASIQRTADDVASRMEKVRGVVDVTSGVSFGSPEMTYRIDAPAAGRLGLASAEVESQLRTALLGEEATKLRRADTLMPVVVRYPDSIRRDVGWLARLPIATAAGKMIPASLVSTIEEKININELARENQQPVVSVEANISGTDLGSAAAAIRKSLETIPHARDIRFELGGQVQSQEMAFRNLLLVLGLAVGLVFVLLVIQFRSFRLPFIIFLTLPPSQIGGLLLLRLTGTPLNISSIMGLIMLVGLVVKNGIIFIEYAAQLRLEGVPTLAEALATAGRVRLRPILMTSLTAIIALLPLALNLGSGAELQRPLAIAVIGGLSVSTLFTLFIVPVVHLLLGEPASMEEEIA